jgi:type VI secretion system secreted protein Hcp
MAVSFLLDIQGIPGESLDNNAAFSKKIEIDGWGFGHAQSGVQQSGTGLTSGKVTAQDFTFTKHVDISSPKILQFCAMGQQVDSATLTCRRTGLKGGGLTPYLKVVFTNVMLSSYQTSGGQNDSGLPAEHISFDFAKIEYQYTPQDAGSSLGTLSASYDLTNSQTAT